MATLDLALEKGLPANLDAERFVLGSILLNDVMYLQVAGAVDRTTSASKSTAAFSRA